MRILHLTSHLNVGGITRYVLSLVQRQVARGHRVILGSDDGDAKANVQASGAVHWRLPLHTSAEFAPQVFWAIQRLTTRLQQEPVDIVHAHTRVGQVVAACVARRLQLPYITTWHGLYTRRLGRQLWPCTGDLTVAISGLVQDHLRQVFRVPASHLRRVYNGIDTAHYATLPDPESLQAYRERWRIPVGCPVIGGMGRLAAGRVKGFDTLLAAAYCLEEAFPDLQVLVVGDGPRRPFLQDIAERLGIQTRVHFVGSAEDIRVPLALVDVFVFSSRWPEAFGLTLIEAMAAGKPVLATTAGAVPEIIQHGVEGWLVPPDDPISMAEGAARLLSDRAAACQMGRLAQARVREAFSLERMAAEIETVYQEALSSRVTKSLG